ncbi:hypothetical protein [Altererythrobacter sp. Root672]|uniref:hypothetical protein n=1 Tax=Altererythrobacter sp. Root672 TaxID=1736584 RepID=UPI0006FED54F|nr:hypothetical protein [Altererythrobacter sp. Root672]KRA83278.1 hypothetical protein ASD76_04245 [Altererythrobacter sp. Root672]
MFPKTGNACRKSRGGLSSALALALALTGGAVVGTAMTASPAFAQNSKGFAAAYKPVADITNAPGGDLAAAKAQLPGVIAAAETPDDKNIAGNLSLILGNKLNDPVLQRQGLELMLASGKVDPAQVGELQFLVGNLAYNAKDFPAARTALLAAVAAGRTADNPEGLIAESYFGEGQNAQGLDYLQSQIEKRVAAGQPVPDQWLVRGLQVAYNAKLDDKTLEWSTLLVTHGTSDKKWLQALQVVNSLTTTDKQAQLDLLRLMALTNAMSDRREYVTYIETADPRVMSNEVGRVLDAAVQAGVMTTGDQYYSEVKRVVDERAAADRKDAPQLAADARKSGSGRDAQVAGDVFLSIGSYAEAEEMFKLALEKGGVDRDQTLTRLGIAQVHQNRYSDAQATFGQVTGARATVARMWAAYADSRA